ncbi:hypothetical protein NHX12_015821 [Muraenolepis orangiensis]|uniref:Histone chaperone domain-containing protein n=1 Tax=Muraenolepis orangiensis TaxID=630683 RepID=A0A9Q0I1Y2_9TELE|nr:hypothetical protein NHX12_015821 [Muraenolepis orangiensis]
MDHNKETQMRTFIKDRDTSESEKASVVPSSSKRKREEEDKLSAKRICLSSSSGGMGVKSKHVYMELKTSRCHRETAVRKARWIKMVPKNKWTSPTRHRTGKDPQKGGKGGEKTGSGKQQANPSSEDEKESSPSLSDEEEDKDSKKGNAPGDKLDGKRKGGRKPESGKQQANPSSEDEKDEDEKESSPPQSDKESEEEDKDSKKKKTKTPGNTFDGKQKGGKGGEKTGSGKKQANPSSDEEKESSPPPSDEEEDKDPKKKHTPKQDGGNSEDADGDKAGEVPPTMKTNKDAQDSDSSSSLCSLEDEKDGDKKLTKKNRDRKKPNVEDSEKEKHGEVKVLRLKRYIALCGLKRNYKKLLEGCRSVHSKVAVLKKELEDAGIKGQPSLKKCKKVQLKIEEARDLADLDVSNIISTQGRPKRRAASPWGKPQASPAARYKRTVNSDSEDSSPTDHKPQRRTDWGNLRGIISNDEGDSD